MYNIGGPVGERSVSATGPRAATAEPMSPRFPRSPTEEYIHSTLSHSPIYPHQIAARPHSLALPPGGIGALPWATPPPRSTRGELADDASARSLKALPAIPPAPLDPSTSSPSNGTFGPQSPLSPMYSSPESSLPYTPATPMNNAPRNVMSGTATAASSFIRSRSFKSFRTHKSKKSTKSTKSVKSGKSNSTKRSSGASMARRYGYRWTVEPEEGENLIPEDKMDMGSLLGRAVVLERILRAGKRVSSLHTNC